MLSSLLSHARGAVPTATELRVPDWCDHGCYHVSGSCSAGPGRGRETYASQEKARIPLPCERERLSIGDIPVIGAYATQGGIRVESLYTTERRALCTADYVEEHWPF